MSGHKNFRALREPLRASPEYARLIEGRRAVQEMELVDAVQALTALREARGVTQMEIAEAWDTTQSKRIPLRACAGHVPLDAHALRRRPWRAAGTAGGLSRSGRRSHAEGSEADGGKGAVEQRGLLARPAAPSVCRMIPHHPCAISEGSR